MEENSDLKTLPDISRQKTELAVPCLSDYPTLESFSDAYQPSKVHILTREDEKRCVLTERSPTLSMLSKQYGERASLTWLCLILSYYNELSSSGKKMEAFQIEACASAIAFEYFYLKASEILLFFKLLLSGRFGKQVFGGLDPYSINSCIKEYFLPLRAYHIDKDEREKCNERREKMFKEAEHNPEKLEKYREQLINHFINN